MPLLCEEARLVKLSNLSFDGSKMKANASKHKAISYRRMAEPQLEAWIAEKLSASEAADTAKHAPCKADRRA
jgi:hypothetical protein